MRTRINGFWGMVIGLGGVLALFLVEHIIGVQSVAALVRPALDRQRSRRVRLRHPLQAWRELSMRDALTCVYNRNFFFPEFERQIAMAKRYGHPVSLVMLDLDRFKQHNDAFGHPEGDALLKDVAMILQQNVRETDNLAASAATSSSCFCPIQTTARPSSLSKGSNSGWPPNCPSVPSPSRRGSHRFRKTGTTTRELLHRADAALYRAKECRDAVFAYRDIIAESPGRSAISSEL